MNKKLNKEKLTWRQRITWILGTLISLGIICGGVYAFAGKVDARYEKAVVAKVVKEQAAVTHTKLQQEVQQISQRITAIALAERIGNIQDRIWKLQEAEENSSNTITSRSLREEIRELKLKKEQLQKKLNAIEDKLLSIDPENLGVL